MCNYSVGVLAYSITESAFINLLGDMRNVIELIAHLALHVGELYHLYAYIDIPVALTAYVITCCFVNTLYI